MAEVIFDNPLQAQVFRRCLSRIKTRARVYTDDDGNLVLAVRPVEFPTLRFHLNNNGMENCEIANEALKKIEHDFSPDG